MTLTADSLDYMLEMLTRMPAAKSYRDGTTIGDHDLTTLAQDFALFSDKRGALEAKAPVISDVRPSGRELEGARATRARFTYSGRRMFPGVETV